MLWHTRRGQCTCISPASNSHLTSSSAVYLFHLLGIMAASSVEACEPLSDTKTYTYSDLDTGFRPPSSCFHHTYTSVLNGYDYYSSSTAGSVTKSYISLDVYRGREPACLPPHYPAACSYLGTFTQDLANLYDNLPGSTTQFGIMVVGTTWSETRYVYSPATCPWGYAPVSTSLDASVTNLTRAICCPM